jgi:hypothetical protein
MMQHAVEWPLHFGSHVLVPSASDLALSVHRLLTRQIIQDTFYDALEGLEHFQVQTLRRRPRNAAWRSESNDRD